MEIATGGFATPNGRFLSENPNVKLRSSIYGSKHNA
jgi:hypothetical protein